MFFAFVGAAMITAFSDPFEALFNLQRALDAHLASDWLRDTTTSKGPYPPINVFQQDDSFVAIVELPGVNKNELQIQAKENTIRIGGKRLSTTRRMRRPSSQRVSGEFDRTLTLPFKSIPMASRRNIATACSPCSSPAPKAINRGPSGSNSRLVPEISEAFGVETMASNKSFKFNRNGKSRKRRGDDRSGTRIRAHSPTSMRPQMP